MNEMTKIDLIFSVPESKQHMVLPEIEEEDEDLNQRHSKLSLTSLLLGKKKKLKEKSKGSYSKVEVLLFYKVEIMMNPKLSCTITPISESTQVVTGSVGLGTNQNSSK